MKWQNITTVGSAEKTDEDVPLPTDSVGLAHFKCAFLKGVWFGLATALHRRADSAMSVVTVSRSHTDHVWMSVAGNSTCPLKPRLFTNEYMEFYVQQLVYARCSFGEGVGCWVFLRLLIKALFSYIRGWIIFKLTSDESGFYGGAKGSCFSIV